MIHALMYKYQLMAESLLQDIWNNYQEGSLTGEFSAVGVQAEQKKKGGLINKIDELRRFDERLCGDAGERIDWIWGMA